MTELALKMTDNSIAISGTNCHLFDPIACNNYNVAAYFKIALASNIYRCL